MGSRLAELWARGGYKVLVGSRDQLRGEETARRLTESISNQVTSSIEGGTMEWAADQGDIIVLATPFTATIQVLSVIQEFIHGQHKIILDITNPIYDHNAIESVAALDLHMAFLDDPTASWAVGYKSVFVNRLNFGSRHSQTIDICGDRKARMAVADLVRCHGWTPRIRGEVSMARALEPGRRVAYIKQMFGDS
mmetsp:Transcript_8065/g.26997  ORF Transcript_8065/g.26997 Transcript_8065/m.26997 type:complete len:194 (+) Transcript_8065:1275-1856(+)